MDLTRFRFSQIATSLGFSPGLMRPTNARVDAETSAGIATGSAIPAGSPIAAGSAVTATAGPGNRPPMEPEILRFSGYGWMPNNPRLPVLVYRNALRLHSTDPAAQFEALFARNGWPPQWRNGVYSFHHYHSTAHEVMGVAAGEAELLLGGEQGTVVAVRSGDVVLLPIGTGHCRISASRDFLVVGAYPPDQHWDICRSAPSPDAERRMRSLAFPKSDPVYGVAGPMLDLWS